MLSLARAMVLTTVVLLFVAIIAAHDMLSQGSGTYFATFMFVPFAIAPGILVWFKPSARSFAIWATCSGFASIIYLIGGSPYEYESGLRGWWVIETAMNGAMVISCIGAMIMAWTSAARAREALPDSSRARRIRSIAKLAPAIAVIAFGLAIVVVEHHIARALFAIGSFLALTVAPAPFVHRRPTRGTAFLWAAWAIPYAGLTLLLQFSEDDKMPTLVRLFLMASGTLAALLVAVLPLSALFASDKSEIPEARVD